MKPQLLKVSNDNVHSFNLRRDLAPNINNRWHYHAEIEFIYFKKGTGTQFVGDHISRFQSGDVVIIGPYLPHYWRFDDCHFDQPEKTATDVRVVHFEENFWGKDFIQLPENKLIKAVLEQSKRGIKVQGRAKQQIAAIFDAMLDDNKMNKIILLMEALTLATSCRHEQLSSIVFTRAAEDQDNDRIDAIYKYSLKNFRSPIKLEEIAAVAHISPSAFCRFFKTKTRKTYTWFVNEIKVGHACKLLIENRMNVKQVCYECGFNNSASFHKFFKKVTGKSPVQYQREYLAETPVFTPHSGSKNGGK